MKPPLFEDLYPYTKKGSKFTLKRSQNQPFRTGMDIGDVCVYQKGINIRMLAFFHIGPADEEWFLLAGDVALKVTHA